MSPADRAVLSQLADELRGLGARVSWLERFAFIAIGIAASRGHAIPFT